MKKIRKPSDRRREAVIKLQKEVKDLKTIISKNDAVIRRKDLQIAGLKKELKKTENLTFRERIFGKKKKKPEPRRMINQSLKGLQDQVSATIKSWKYSDDDIAELFGTTKRNIRRFIKRNGLR